MSIILNDNFSSEFNKPLDNRYGPYVDIATALSEIPTYRRFIGLTVGIGSNPVIEYWFNDGILDTDFVVKIPNVNYPVTSVNSKTGAVVLNKTDIGLSNVDNTSDANKPISNATQTALNGKQNSLGFTPEDVTNKSTTLDTDKLSNTKYPSVKSVYDWATLTFQTALGFTPVTNARTISINGTSYDLSANRSWSVGDLVSSGSYSNPTWLTSLAWGKITSTPTTLSGYGITDAVPSSRTLTINGTTYDLSANRTWTISTATPTLDAVTTAGNTTTNSISIGKVTTAGSITASAALAQGSYFNNILVAAANNDVLVGLDINPTYSNGAFTGVSNIAARFNNFKILVTDAIGTTQDNTSVLSFGMLNGTGTLISGSNIIGSYFQVFGNNYTNAFNQRGGANFVFDTRNSGTGGFSIQGTNGSTWTNYFKLFTTGNILIQSGGAFTDAGYKFDVNGTARIQSDVLIKGSNNTASNNALQITNSSGTNILYVRNDSYARIDGTLKVTTDISLLSDKIYGSNQNNYLSINLPRIRIGGTVTGYTAGTVVSLEGSQTASSGLAQGTYLLQTLVAAANNDVLVGLDINPTFTNGAFTGVSNIGVRVQNNVNSIFGGIEIRNSNSGTASGAGINIFNDLGAISVQAISSNYTSAGTIQANTGRIRTGTTLLQGLWIGTGAGSLSFFAQDSEKMRINTNGNILIGTTTDSGYKLDVNGTARIQNVLTLGSLSADPTGANGMIYYNTTLGIFRVYQSGAWKTITAV